MKAMFKANSYPSRFCDKLAQQFYSRNGSSNQSFVDIDQAFGKSTHEYLLGCSFRNIKSIETISKLWNRNSKDLSRCAAFALFSYERN